MDFPAKDSGVIARVLEWLNDLGVSAILPYLKDLFFLLDASLRMGYVVVFHGNAGWSVHVLSCSWRSSVVLHFFGWGRFPSSDLDQAVLHWQRGGVPTYGLARCEV